MTDLLINSRIGREIEMEVTVSEAVATYFYEQVCGMYSGHMAGIPNNPVLYGLAKAHRVDTHEDFARFLRQCADQLTKEQPF